MFVLKARVKTDNGGALNKPTSTRRMGRQGVDVVMLKMKPGKELATVRRKEGGKMKSISAVTVTVEAEEEEDYVVWW